jgi:RNA polymerase sigma-70 factor (ECF subfamily)
VSKSVKVRQYAEEAMAPGQRSVTKRSSISRFAASVTGGRIDDASPAERDNIVAAIPHLRAFAILFCGNVVRADDFVHEALLRALASINSARPGANFRGWLFAILRNLIQSDYRKRGREAEGTDGSYLDSLKSPPERHGRLELQEVRVALPKLPSNQREALLLVGASGFTYEQVAAICEISAGTVKSRVNRARTRLSELVALDSADSLARTT